MPAALIGALCLSGCGFHPLYGRNSYDSNVLDELASIYVDPLREHQGQLVRNALVTALSPEGEMPHPRYHLGVTWVTSQAQQALRADDTATREIDNYSVTYRLYESGTPILAGTFNQTYSFDFLLDHYANVAAEENMRHRAAEAIAEELRNRLAAYFAKAAEQKSAAK